VYVRGYRKGIGIGPGEVACGPRFVCVSERFVLEQAVAVVSSLPRRRYTGRPAHDPRRLAPDVNMHSPDGLKFARIYDVLAMEFPEADPMRLRDLALLRYSAERAVAAGAWEDVVRLHNAIERKEARLRAKARQREAERPTVGLRAKLEAKLGKGGAGP
jgi:hypothetical protein